MQISQADKAAALTATVANINAQFAASKNYVYDPVASRAAIDARMDAIARARPVPVFGLVNMPVIRISPPMPSAEIVTETLDALKKLQDYEARLKRFDWHFEFSEDYSVISSARADLVTLYTLQGEIDPSGEFWDLYKPNSIGVPCAQKVVAA